MSETTTEKRKRLLKPNPIYLVSLVYLASLIQFKAAPINVYLASLIQFKASRFKSLFKVKPAAKEIYLASSI